MQTLAQRYRDEGAKKSEEKLAQERQKFKQEKLKAAKQMLADDMPIEKIVKYTGLTEKEVRALLH